MKKIISFIFYPPVLMLILLNILPSALMPKLAFNNAPEVYLPKHVPSVELKEKLSQSYPVDQVAMYLLEGKDLFGNDFLEKLDKLTLNLQREPLIERIINVTEMEHIHGTEEGFEASNLMGIDRRKELSIEKQRYQFILQNKTANNLIVSANNPDLMLLVIRPVKLDSTMQRIEVLEKVEQELQQLDIKKYVIARAGPIVTEVEQFNEIISDMMVLVPGTTFIGLALIWFMFKRVLAVIIAGLLIGAVVNTSMSLFVIFSVPYTSISSMLAPLMSALSTAFLLHFYSYLKLGSKFQYIGKERVNYALKQVNKPAIYSAITTILGLSTMYLSPILPIGHFGLISAFGVFSAYYFITLYCS
ncbi:MAG: hypothetical protein HQL46_15645 [Gammaproteobacteria bacterium]|nr:hypothetical protein [Gammaproteobacteria bacterium]